MAEDEHGGMETGYISQRYKERNCEERKSCGERAYKLRKNTSKDIYH